MQSGLRLLSKVMSVSSLPGWALECADIGYAPNTPPLVENFGGELLGIEVILIDDYVAMWCG